MDAYQIIVTPDAELDLLKIRNYIAHGLQVPNVALKYIQSIRTEIQKLAYMASSVPPIQDEPWHSHGIRKITAKKFLIYYRIDEQTRTVYVMNVIYSRRDQLKALVNMNIES
ncbi:MAG: type II toxin-antitoxin system RelE/ParE family toxin [Megasphaera massiliensis]|uniref:type II toxin-antitoxin system RelE/ParE family toxin n=1 Tax=Megasphaera massiliensis TaxID=1232428 RepID=UPI002108FEB6|nr:type II toxin-antitoxin system RelE/ParE family toxin [Megasphaera massiliensis]MCQ5209658.1 type II toxin-antitoxin system RelE/ParE family toxin [Megasphaera massiliensis]MEE0658192.1 type II toxin-antitoxin system RelE/ParE family toxin [Megasphaera massiliensis]